MQKFKRLKLWLVIGMGVLPFTPLPMAVQVAVAVGIVVLLMALSAMARNPGTVREGGSVEVSPSPGRADKGHDKGHDDGPADGSDPGGDGGAD